MSSSGESTVEKTSHRSWGSCGSNYGRRGHWTAGNIAAMVVGFVLFWPVGLLILFWTMSGRPVRELPGAIREKWAGFAGQWGGKRHSSNNNVFNEFQQTQYDRIREIKDEIKERSSRFNDFRADAKRRADEEEFNQFMASSPTSK